MLDETLGKVHFWLTFIGFHMTFLVQHWLGNEGMPRQHVDYLPTDGFRDVERVLPVIQGIRARRLDTAVPVERLPAATATAGW